MMMMSVQCQFLFIYLFSLSLSITLQVFFIHLTEIKRFSSIDLSLNHRLVSNSHFSLSVFRLRLNIQLKGILDRDTNSLVRRQTVGHSSVINQT